MLPGAPPDPETLPPGPVLAPAPPCFGSQGSGGGSGGRGLQRRKPLPVGVPAHGAPWAEHQDLEPFLFYLFSQITVGRSLSEIPGVPGGGGLFESVGWEIWGNMN